MTAKTKKYYPALDIAKFFMAILIMFAHISSENVSINPKLKMVFSLYDFAVPFFFACSGYLFFLHFKAFEQKNNNSEYINFSKRIGLMYLIWSLIYFGFVLTGWIINKTETIEILKYFHKALFFSTYGTIWFLPALWIGVTIVFFLLKKNVKIEIIGIIAIIMWILGSLGYSYTKLIKGTFIENLYSYYNMIFVTTRNGFFSGFPMVFIGAYLAFTKENKNNQLINFIGLFASSSFFVMEAFFIKTSQMGANNDMGIMLIPSTYFMMKWMININIEPRKIFIWMRQMSMVIFLGQRLFITAIPSLLPIIFIHSLAQKPYLGLLVYSGSVLIFSAFIIKLSKRFKLFKKLW